MADLYTGPVCFMDGWHYTTTTDADGNETPADRLFCNDDGTYRLAADSDPSWFDRKHTAFAVVMPDDGGSGIPVSKEEAGKVQELLASLRGVQS